MSTQHRKNCLLVLLVILIGHAALTLHANSHVAVEQQGCDLCTHYSGFEHAPPPAPLDAFPRADHASEPSHVPLQPPAASTVGFRQRAPPAA